MENSMEQLDRDTDGSSLNIVESNIDQLKALFPDIVSEGKIDFDKLRETLGDTVETQEERYNFSWNGKAMAKRIAQTQSTGTLRPCKAESKHWDSTQNLFIEGDNLEVLKLLQKSYHKQVKMIYIDPPYNTGKEFIYPDNYKDNLDTYLQYTHQKDQDGRKFGTNADTSGRYHTNWLNMMYPRLKLAKNLLKDDGVIFISIDDNEQANLRKLCDEIFGEENFIANLIWKSRLNKDNRSETNVSKDHEYILCYGKTLRGSLRDASQYSNPDKDTRGDWTSANMVGLATKERRPNLHYDLVAPNGINYGCPDMGWRYDPRTMQQLIKEIRILWPDQSSGRPRRKVFINELGSEFTGFSSIITNAGYTRDGTAEVDSIFGFRLMDFPKPVAIAKQFIEQGLGDKEGIILDFFAGSGTTAHAVMLLNAEDEGKRKFIMVQLPELTDKSDYPSIADIGKERIRRAGEKILQDNTTNEGIENLDIGFKVFKLDSSNIKPWDADFDNLDDTLLNIVDNIKEDRSEDDVLTEILLKYGLDLTVPIEERQINSKTVYSIGLGALVICLDDAITLDVVEGIGRLKEELDPEVMRVVFKDSGFQDDVVKTNAIQVLKKYGINDVKSL